MKSSAAQLGLEEMAAICKRMELKGLSSSDESWQVLMKEFEASLENVLARLTAEQPAQPANP